MRAIGRNITRSRTGATITSGNRIRTRHGELMALFVTIEVTDEMRTAWKIYFVLCKTFRKCFFLLYLPILERREDMAYSYGKQNNQAIAANSAKKIC